MEVMLAERSALTRVISGGALVCVHFIPTANIVFRPLVDAR